MDSDRRRMAGSRIALLALLPLLALLAGALALAILIGALWTMWAGLTVALLLGIHGHIHVRVQRLAIRAVTSFSIFFLSILLFETCFWPWRNSSLGLLVAASYFAIISSAGLTVYILFTMFFQAQRDERKG